MTVLSSVDLQSGTSSFLRKHHAKQTPFLPIISFSLLNGTSAFQSLVLMLQWQWWFSVQQQLRSWQFSGRAPLEEGETLGGWDSQPVLESASVPGIGFRKYLGSLRNVNLWDYFNLSSPTYGIKTHFVEWNWNPEGPPMLHLTSSMENQLPGFIWLWSVLAASKNANAILPSRLWWHYALPFGLWPKERKTLCLLPTIVFFWFGFCSSLACAGRFQILYFSSTQGSYFKTH